MGSKKINIEKVIHEIDKKPSYSWCGVIDYYEDNGQIHVRIHTNDFCIDVFGDEKIEAFLDILLSINMEQTKKDKLKVAKRAD